MSWQHFTYTFTAIVVGVDLLRFAVPAMNREVLKYVSAFAQQHETRRLTSASWFWIAMCIVATFGEREFFSWDACAIECWGPCWFYCGT